MVKFLHTADWHLGIKYTQFGEKADKARQIRIQTIEKLVNTAKNENVDFVLVAGDLFDSNDLDHRIVNTVIEILASAPNTPFYIIPGNHDPLTRDSLYWDPVWESLDNVTIFKEADPFLIPHHDVTIFPCPVSQKQSKKDLTDWIQVDDSKSSDNGINLGLAHGNLAIEGFIDNANFPINPDRTQLSSLDYLALGEWHSLYEHKDHNGISRTIYPGTPETTKFGENNSGKSVIVEINSPKSTPNIKELNLGTLTWEKQDVEINNMKDAQTLNQKLENTNNPQNNVISLNLLGVTDQDTINYLESLQDHYMDKFMLLNIFKENLYLKPNFLEIKALLPEGAIVGQTFEALMALMKTQPLIQEYSDISSERAGEIFKELREIQQLEGLSPEILNRALMILYQMIREASQ